MKYKTLTIVCLFILCYGSFNAQNYIEPTSSNKEKPVYKLQPHFNPMPDWEKNWTKESVIAINEIIKEYGYPVEYSPNRMHWIIPGEIKRTITYTENFLLYLPFETYSCNTDSLALIVKNRL